MKSSWEHLKKISTLCIFLSYFLLVSSAVSSHREKRGASVYPVFGGNNYGAHGSEQNNFLYLNDPSPFIQYLGGSPSSSRYGSSGSGMSHSPSASTYSFSFQPAPSSSSSGSTALDFNLLNSYAMSSNHMNSGSGSGSGSSSSSGWSPNLGYTGSFYTTDFGLLTPNFASMPMSSASSGRNTHTAALPTLSATNLAHSASMSFNAQNHLYDVLLSGSPSPRSYKGSIE